MIRQNLFRTDLFHRLNVLSIHIPPLRDHSEDVAPLIEHFLQKYRSLAPATGVTVGTDFLEALLQVELPGNIRQLENLVRQALVGKSTDLPLSISDLPVETLLELVGNEKEKAFADRSPKEPHRGGAQTPVTSFVRLLDASDWNLTRSMEICEQHVLEAAMARTQGNQSEAAKLLGITPRSVYNKLRKYKYDLARKAHAKSQNNELIST